MSDKHYTENLNNYSYLHLCIALPVHKRHPTMSHLDGPNNESCWSSEESFECRHTGHSGLEPHEEVTHFKKMGKYG